MTVVTIIEEKFVSTIHDFLTEFGLMEQFLKDEELASFDDWEYPVTDQELIVKYLDKMPDNYIVFYDSHGDGDFWIAKMKIEPLQEHT